MLVTLLNLAAAVALLVWSIRMIRTGVERGSMPRIRQGLRQLSGNPMRSAFGGAIGAMVMQSSTAVVLIASGFAVSGMLTKSASLAMVLGADLGSAMMAWVLFLPIQNAVPAFMLLGIALFLKSKNSNVKQFGRVLIGLAFVLMSIGMIRQAVSPLQENGLLRVMSVYLDGDFVSAFVLGAAIAWLMHSSLATVIMIATFATSGVISTYVALAMVIGANLGGALIPVGLLWSSPRAARVIVLGNLMGRGLATAAAMALLMVAPPLDPSDISAGQIAIASHITLNAVLLLWVPAVHRLVGFSDRILPKDKDKRSGPVTVLDPKTLENPNLALANAKRELTVMYEQMQTMFTQVMQLFRTFDPQLARSIERREKSVDASHYELKLFLAKLRAQPLSHAQAKQTLDMINLANNIEEAADHISSSLVALACKMDKENTKFSDQGLADIEQFHDQIMMNGQLAYAVLTTGDLDTARLVFAEKDRIRAEERRLQERHLLRLQTGSKQSRATTNIHQETLRLLKHINAAISYVAYPIVQENGDLLDSRLTSVETKSSRVGVS